MTETTESHPRSTRFRTSTFAALATVPLIGLASVEIDLSAPAGATSTPRSEPRPSRINAGRGARWPPALPALERYSSKPRRIPSATAAARSETPSLA